MSEQRSSLHFSPNRPFTTCRVDVPENAVLETGFTFFYPPRKPKADEVLRLNTMDALFTVVLLTDRGKQKVLHQSRHSSSELKGWHDLTLDLSDYSGQRVSFRLEWSDINQDQEPDSSRIRPVWSVPRMFWKSARAETGTRLIILVSLDTLRADAIGCQGYHRTVSPMIDRFSRDAVQYTDCVSPSPWTRPAHMSILTSLYPHVHGLDRSTDDLNLSPSFSTWAEICQQAGFWTVAVTGGGFVHSNHGFERGFHQFHVQKEDFAKQCSRALGWIASRRDDDQFVFLHTFATHSPYNQFGTLIKHSAGVTDRARNIPPRKAGLPPRAEAQRLRRLYDDGILYADFCLGSFLRELQRLGIYDRAMIILLSDHGELFYEHGVFGHSTRLYDQLLKVPLLVKYRLTGSGAPLPSPGSTVRRQVRLIDILPTVTEVCGITTPASQQFQGLSLLSGERPVEAPESISHPNWLYAETYHGGKTRRGIRTDSLSYVVNETDGVEELYDLTADPQQLRNLVDRPGEKQNLTLHRCRLVLGFADSMRFDGLHLSTVLNAGDEGRERISGTISAACTIHELRAHFPDSAGSVQLEQDKKSFRFDFTMPGSKLNDPAPREITFTLAEPDAEIQVHIDEPVENNAMVQPCFGKAGVLGIPAIRADDPRLILPWHLLPGDAGSGSSIHLYKRPLVEQAEPAALNMKQRQALQALGYILEDD